MGKYQFHVTKQGRKPEVVRHYKWLIKMYRFVLRNPKWFKDVPLTIWKNDRPFLNVDFDFICERAWLNLTETEERKVLNKLASEKEKEKC